MNVKAHERVHIPLLVVLVVAAIASVAAAKAATAPKLPDLPVSFVVCPDGKSIPLQAGVTYQASKFPIALRLTPPDGSWSGGQWKTASAGCDASGGGFPGYPPYYGWVSFGHGSGASLPRGSVVISTSYGQTPSAATAVNRLRNGLPRNEASYQPTTRIRLAGFYGYQFDGQIIGERHIFLPFTKPGGAAGGGPDHIEFEAGWVFRIIVLNVRGKTVVIYIANVALPANRFPAFLNQANRILRTLAFPKGA
jgi:hypothetical protein